MYGKKFPNVTSTQFFNNENDPSLENNSIFVNDLKKKI